MNRRESARVCIFCKQAAENPVEMGDFLSYKEMHAHTYCLVSAFAIFSFISAHFRLVTKDTHKHVQQQRKQTSILTSVHSSFAVLELGTEAE